MGYLLRTPLLEQVVSIVKTESNGSNEPDIKYVDDLNGSFCNVLTNDDYRKVLCHFQGWSDA